MKLNKKDIEELRKDIEERLSKVPDGKRIYLDKELLDELLFETFILDKEKGIKLKIPVWSGEFLRKIDLSHVDFSYVSWGILNPSRSIVNDLNRYENTLLIGKIRENVFNKYVNRPYLVDYSETNANIDLTKSFEALQYRKISINNCNFEGLDFSKQCLSTTYYDETFPSYLTGIIAVSIFSSDLTNTELYIPKATEFEASYSLLRGTNLSEKNISIKKYFEAIKNDDPSGFSNCDMCYTGINFLISPDSITDVNRKEFVSAIRENAFLGCYINGKKILLPRERKENAALLKKEYLEMKSEILASVDEQFMSFGKSLKKAKKQQ